MNIELIAAMDDNNAIGIDNQLPWHIRADLQHFKQLTIGKPCLMGRNTFESIGKALPNRTNIVLTRNTKTSFPAPVQTFNSVEKVLEAFGSEKTLMVIGGQQLYEQCLSMAAVLHITHVHTALQKADSFFPKIDPTLWVPTQVEDHVMDPKSQLSYSFTTYQRTSMMHLST